MSTNTPPNGFGYGQNPQGPQGPGQPQQPAGFPQNPQGAFGAPPANPQKQRLLNLIVCGIPLLIAFISLFLPYFKVSYMGESESVSWAQGDSDGPFIFALIFILLAIVPLVLQFIPKINPKQLVSSAGIVIAAGVVIIANVIYNWSPEDGEDLAGWGLDVGRGIGFWLLLISGLALIAAGAFFVRWATQQAKAAGPVQGGPRPGYPPYPGPQAPGQQAPGQYQQAPGQYQQAPGQPAPGQQTPGQQASGQPFGAPQGQPPFNPQAPGQSFGAPQGQPPFASGQQVPPQQGVPQQDTSQPGTPQPAPGTQSAPGNQSAPGTQSAPGSSPDQPQGGSAL